MDKTATKNMYRLSSQLEIRPLAKEDKDVWLNRVAKGTDEKDFAKYLNASRQQQKEDKSYSLAVFSKNGDYLANILISGIVRDIYQSAFISIYSFSKSIGDNLFKEAIVACLDISFKELSLHRLEILYVNDLSISKNIFLEIGFRSEGKRISSILWKDKWQDAEVFALTLDEYKRKNIEKTMFYGTEATSVSMIAADSKV